MPRIGRNHQSSQFAHAVVFGNGRYALYVKQCTVCNICYCHSSGGKTYQTVVGVHEEWNLKLFLK